jgi:glycosyltransferase involved in cell wall biosynthesis
MRICIVGKFPPIQGGVSAQTYWSAHTLARRGHEVHVITNAEEMTGPFRMHMRPEDLARCEASYGDGLVRVHWTAPLDQPQAHLPQSSPFVSKLATLAARAHTEHAFDVVFSYYLEPYGVAGHLAAQMIGRPHVVRTAGSDAGRLWHHPQFELLYDHVLRSAEVVVASGAVAERARARGIDSCRIAVAGGLRIPEHLFAPEGSRLDIQQLLGEVERDPDSRRLAWGGFSVERPYFGVYGKLGKNKGTFALLAAMRRLKEAGLDVGLVALAHGAAAVEQAFRDRASELGLADRILQLPFLPHWRVPEFLRGCLAVCCLEQDFPIEFHAPIIPREVMLCGTCLVASTELLRKLPGHERIPHGYGCIAVENVNDADALSEALAVIVRDPSLAVAIGARGHKFAQELQQEIRFPETLECILQAGAMQQRLPEGVLRPQHPVVTPVAESRFRLSQIVAIAIGYAFGPFDPNDRSPSRQAAIEFESARLLLENIETAIAGGHSHLRPFAAAVQTEIAVAAAEDEFHDEGEPAATEDPLFRLRSRRWGFFRDRIAELVPVRDARLRILEFDHDVTDFLGAKAASDLPAILRPGPGYVAAFARGGREPLVIDGLTAHILKLSDGTRSVTEIANALSRMADCSAKPDILDWTEHMFVGGLIALQDGLNAEQGISLSNPAEASAVADIGPV